jgi:hypothetical protein
MRRRDFIKIICWLGGSLAARGTRAAGRTDAGHRIPSQRDSKCLCTRDGCVP